MWVVIHVSRADTKMPIEGAGFYVSINGIQIANNYTDRNGYSYKIPVGIAGDLFVRVRSTNPMAYFRQCERSFFVVPDSSTLEVEVVLEPDL